MSGLDQFKHDISEMKAATLGKCGRKVEIATEMLEREQNLNIRLCGMLKKIDQAKHLRISRKKRKKYSCVLERLKKKLSLSSRKIIELEKIRRRAMDEYKAQREVLGLMDHEFIDNYYSD
jgi:hypothetical protein